MASYASRRAASRRRHEKRVAKKARSKKNKVGRIIGIICAVLIVSFAAVAVAYVASKWGKVEKTKKVNPDDLSINREVEHDSGYLNVALFGLDSRDDDLGTGNRSDTMMVASLNKETGEIKIVSVYRDTLLELEDGSYNKANAAYSFGDAEAAMSLINRNLDLDVQNYVACTWKALIHAIDAVGGIEADVKEEEIDYLNGYQMELIKCTGIDSWGIEKPGKQKLNGTQATAYARIRYTEGGDFTRTERQRDVLEQLAKKLSKCKPRKLNQIIDKVFPEIKTNFSMKEVLSYVPKVKRYKVSDTMGFPVATSFTNLEGIGSCVIAEDFSDDVSKVHKFLFNGSDNYAPSEKIKSIAANILEYKSKGNQSDTYDNTYDETYQNTTQQYQNQYNPYGTTGNTGYGTNQNGYGYNNGYNTNTAGGGTDTSGGTDTTGGGGAAGGDTGGDAAAGGGGVQDTGQQ